MPSDRPLAAGPRIARALALFAVALVALALTVLPTPGAARAAEHGAVASTRQAPADEGDDGTDDVTDDDAVADDDPADADEDAAGDEDLSDDDLGDDGDEADAPPLVLVVDVRGRAAGSPKTLGATKTARGTKLRWKAWGAATATGTGRLAFRTAGRRGKAVKGTGTVRLSRLVTCDDGTAVYRRATLAVPHRGRVVATLPGCPVSDD